MRTRKITRDKDEIAFGWFAKRFNYVGQGFPATRNMPYSVHDEIMKTATEHVCLSLS